MLYFGNVFIYLFLWPPYSPALVNESSRKFYSWWTLSVIREVTTWIFSWSSLNDRVGQKLTKFGVFSDPPANFLLLRPNAAEYCNSEKKLLSIDGCSTRNATFRKLWPTNLWDPRDSLLFLKSNRPQHVLFPFARWQNCWYWCTVGINMWIRGLDCSYRASAYWRAILI